MYNSPRHGKSGIRILSQVREPRPRLPPQTNAVRCKLSFALRRAHAFHAFLLASAYLSKCGLLLYCSFMSVAAAAHAPLDSPPPDSAQEDQLLLAESRIRIRNAGGKFGRFVIAADYAPRKGNVKTLLSNHPSYGKSWATLEEINDADKVAFVKWINMHLARGGGHRRRPSCALPLAFERRSSRRCDEAMTVEQAVLNCVRFLVHNVIHRSRHDSDEMQRVNFVVGKRRRGSKKTDVSNLIATRHASYVKWVRRTTKRVRAAALQRRKRTGKGYAYRALRLKRLAAIRAEQDLAWLQFHDNRLATLVARQECGKLLPDGLSARAAMHGATLGALLSLIEHDSRHR